MAQKYTGQAHLRCADVSIFLGPNGTSVVSIILGKGLGKSNPTLNEHLSHRTWKSLSSQAQALKLSGDQVAMVCSHWRAQVGRALLCVLYCFYLRWGHDEELCW